MNTQTQTTRIHTFQLWLHHSEDDAPDAVTLCDPNTGESRCFSSPEALVHHLQTQLTATTKQPPYSLN